MGDDHAARARSSLSLQLADVELGSGTAGVDEDRDASRIADGQGRRGVGVARHQDLVAVLHSQADQGEGQRGGPAGEPHAPGQPEAPRAFGGEALQERVPLRVAAESEGGFELGKQLLPDEAQARGGVGEGDLISERGARPPDPAPALGVGPEPPAPRSRREQEPHQPRRRAAAHTGL